jgi:hypothetical protein
MNPATQLPAAATASIYDGFPSEYDMLVGDLAARTWRLGVMAELVRVSLNGHAWR